MFCIKILSAFFPCFQKFCFTFVRGISNNSQNEPKMKKSFPVIVLIIVFPITVSTLAKAQLSVTSYSIYALGVSTDTQKPFSVELKTFANSSFYNLGFELDLFHNFKTHPYHKFSVGLGLSSQPFNDIYLNEMTLPLVLEIFPLQSFKKLSLLVEFAPAMDVNIEDAGDVSFRHLWGIRYKF